MKRVAAFVAAVALSLVVFAAPAAAQEQADNAEQDLSSCGLIPALFNSCDAVDDIVDRLTPDLPDVGSVLADGAAQAAGNAIGGMLTNAVMSMIGFLAQQVDTTTGVDLQAGWFIDHYKGIAAISLTMILMVAGFAIVSALARGDSGDLLSLFFLRVPGAFLKTMLAIPAITIGLALADAATEEFAGQLGSTTSESVVGLGENLAAVAPMSATPHFGISIVVFILALLGLILSFMWMLMRSVGLHLAAALLPVLFTFGILKSGSKMASQVLSLIVAFIIIKPVLMMSLALGVEAMGATGTSNIGAGFLSAGILGATAIMPFWVISMVPAAMAASSTLVGQRAAMAGAGWLGRHGRSAFGALGSVSKQRRNNGPSFGPSTPPAGNARPSGSWAAAGIGGGPTPGWQSTRQPPRFVNVRERPGTVATRPPARPRPKPIDVPSKPALKPAR